MRKVWAVTGIGTVPDSSDRTRIRVRPSWRMLATWAAACATCWARTTGRRPGVTSGLSVVA